MPFVHALQAFNAVASEGEKLPVEAIQAYYASQTLPAGWVASVPDASFGLHTPLFRRTSGNTRVTIFEGGHAIVHQAALNWLAKKRKGPPVVWEVNDFIPLAADGTSGK